MDKLDANELWRQIPPEEKFDLISKAHAKGITAVAITIGVASTCAVGLQIPPLMWGSFLISPLIFQFIAAKAWRDLRPRLMLEYLAARSVARRFAFMRQSRALTPELIFRGEAEEQFSDDALQEALEAMVNQTRENKVWVALFSDVVVMLSEGTGGARLQFSCPIDKKLTIKSESPSGGGDYANDKQLFLSYQEQDKRELTVKLTSKHPAALVVFEKKLRELQETPVPAVLAAEVPDFLQDALGSDTDFSE